MCIPQMDRSAHVRPKFLVSEVCVSPSPWENPGFVPDFTESSDFSNRTNETDDFIARFLKMYFH